MCVLNTHTQTPSTCEHKLPDVKVQLLPVNYRKTKYIKAVEITSLHNITVIDTKTLCVCLSKIYYFVFSRRKKIIQVWNSKLIFF